MYMISIITRITTACKIESRLKSMYMISIITRITTFLFNFSFFSDHVHDIHYNKDYNLSKNGASSWKHVHDIHYNKDYNQSTQ